MKKLFALSLFLFVGILYAQTDKDLAAEFITKEKVEGHIYFLASDELKGRATGSDEIKIASQYLANQLRSYGAKPVPGANGYFQDVPFDVTTAATTREISFNGKMTETAPLPFLGGNMSHSGDIVFVNYGLADDYQGKDVQGKFVVFKSGTETARSPQEMFNLLGEKREIAAQNGARGAIEMVDINPMIWGFVEHAFGEDRMTLAGEEDDDDGSFGYLWVLDPGNAIANELAGKKNNKAAIAIKGIEKKKIMCRNVVAMIEGTDPKLKNEYIIYGAHYDHVGIGTPDATGDSIYNGARDNAVGTATVLMMAENLGKYPTKRSALFILFTAEEMGLFGSRYYVENPLIPLNQMVYTLNSDNAGYNDTSLVTIFGLYRTNMSDHFKTGASAFGLTAIDDPAPEENLFDRSDNVNFAIKGIPAPTYSMGFTSFSGTLTETYHQPSDVAHTIDYDYLVKFFKSYVLTGRLIANDPQRPFWTPGDKYEAAGRELYGK
jgi:aminopeptidase YwaD